MTADQAIESGNPVLGYNVSKKLAEKAAWQFLKEAKPTFDITVINPDIIIGPMIQPVPGPQYVNETNKFAVYNFLNGTYTQIQCLGFPFYHFVSLLVQPCAIYSSYNVSFNVTNCSQVDVRDVARAHILALTNPAVSDQRILLIAGLITPQLVANIIRKNFPDLRGRVLEGNPETIYPENVRPTGWNVSKSHEVFGKDWAYTDLETSVVETVKCLLKLEEGWKQYCHCHSR